MKTMITVDARGNRTMGEVSAMTSPYNSPHYRHHGLDMCHEIEQKDIDRMTALGKKEGAIAMILYNFGINLIIPIK